MSEYVYAYWSPIFWVTVTLAVVFGVASYILHRYHHRHFTDRKNWGSVLAVATISSIYAFLSGVDILADVKGEVGQPTRATVALYLMGVKGVAITAAGFVGLALLTLRERLEVLHNPSVPEYYTYLFGGFDGDQFFGYGAPFQVEGEWYRRGEDGVCSALAREQLRRLARLREFAMYIFHTRDDFERAKRFFEKGVFPFVGKEVRNPQHQARINQLGKVVLYEPIHDAAADHAAHSYSFFVGTRKGQPCCILYPAHKISRETRQPGCAVLVHNDQEFFLLLKSYFLDQQKLIQDGALRDKYRKHVWTPTAGRFELVA